MTWKLLSKGRRRCYHVAATPVLSLLLLGYFTACADAPTAIATVTTVPSEILYDLTISPHGVTMAQHATQSLTLVARNILGDTISDFDPATVQFASEDSTLVTVSGSVLTAHGITPVDSFSGPVIKPIPTRVIASWQHAGITKADTLYVAVTATIQPVTALSIQPAPYPQDSTWLARQNDDGKLLQVTALSAQHDTIAAIYAFVSTDQRLKHYREYVDPRTGLLSFVAIPAGRRVWVYAEANVYGVILRDSVEYLATDATTSVVYLKPGEQGPQLYLGSIPAPTNVEFWTSPCAIMGFINRTADSLAIRFDDPTVTMGCPNAFQTGNIPLIIPGSFDYRYIRPTGVHHWTVTRPNGSGFTPSVTGMTRVRSHTELE